MYRMLIYLLGCIGIFVILLQHIPTDESNTAYAQSTSELSFAQISAGATHTCAITPQINLVCWGRNSAGQLGNGKTTDTVTAVRTQFTQAISITEISSGDAHSCGLTTVGTIYCWGKNSSGQLGNGSTTTALTPVKVINPTGIIYASISAGGAHSCARTTTGKAYCWGDNSRGQLGDASGVNRIIPTAVKLPVGVSLKDIRVGQYHTCAIATTNTVYCWGDNASGQLGDNSTSQRTAPVAVVAPVSGVWDRISAGAAHTCATTVLVTQLPGQPVSRTPLTAYCWGNNTYGQLGDNSTTQRTSPVPISKPVGVAIATVGAGGSHTCALTPSNIAYCWGNHENGQLGMGTGAGMYRIPTLVNTPVGAVFTSITPHFKHTCAITTKQQAYCWGWNFYGQLGNGSNGVAAESNPFPDLVDRTYVFPTRTPTTYRSPTRTATHSRTATHTPTTSITRTPSSTVPPSITRTPSRTLSPSITRTGTRTHTASITRTATATAIVLTDVATGGDRTCALSAGGRSFCWGWNQFGQAGDGSVSNTKSIPGAVTMPAGTVVHELRVGDLHTCARTATGVLCWGANASGQLGNGSTTNSVVPVTVTLPADITVSQISVGAIHSCLLSSAGTIYCWGSNDNGQLGTGTTTDSQIPVPISISSYITFTHVSAGNSHTCALSSNSSVYCWGWNAHGQLGTGTTDDATIPQPITPPAYTAFAHISSGSNHSCAVSTLERKSPSTR
ncbi:MAG: RCC1 domain-containing protein [Roseiflexaceae bacterium]